MATAGTRQCRKPHFFKPVMPPFQQLSIPRAFLKHLVNEMCEEGVGEATLKNHQCSWKSWRVKVKGFCFTEGWFDFVRDHDLGFGDFVVFRYEGAMVFDVIVFDRRSCEKKYLHLPETAVKMEAQKQQERDDTGDKEEEIKITNSPSGRISIPCNEPTATQDSFKVLITKYNSRKPCVAIPKYFGIANGLVGKIFKAILRDEKGRSWSVRLIQCVDRINIGRGWLEFLSGNHLKEGDSCIFKLVNCKKICRGAANVIVLDVTVSISPPCTETTATQDSFEVLITEYNSRNPRVTIPKHFGIANGLVGKIFKAILRDEKGGSWSVRLIQYGDRIKIGHGWLEFLSGNNLKEGDSCVFKLVNCKNMGVANAIVLDVTVSISSSSTDDDGWSPVNSKNNDQIGIKPSNSFFVTSLKPFNAMESRLRIPQYFASENGLNGKNFTTTLRDRKGRSWRVQLKSNRYHGQMYIYCDWIEISAVNGLKEGDTCIFELIRRGKLQVMEFRLL